MAKRRHIDNKERVKVNKLLEQHLTVLGDNLVKYNDDWSDKKIAEAVAPDLSVNSVAGFRMEVFGNLIQRAPAGGSDPDPRIDQIEQVSTATAKEVQLLLGLLATHISRFNTTLETLELNRVGKFRHLKIDTQKLPLSVQQYTNGSGEHRPHA